jgi:hypothetical protein
VTFHTLSANRHIAAVQQTLSSILQLNGEITLLAKQYRFSSYKTFDARINPPVIRPYRKMETASPAQERTATGEMTPL